MNINKFFIFSFFVVATLIGCKQSEDPQTIYCTEMVPAGFEESFTYSKFTSGESYAAKFSFVSETEVMVRVEDWVSQKILFKVYTKEQLLSLFENIQAKGTCFASTGCASLPMDSSLAYMPDRSISFTDKNGRYCSWEPQEAEPLVLEIENIVSDVLTTGQEDV